MSTWTKVEIERGRRALGLTDMTITQGKVLSEDCFGRSQASSNSRTAVIEGGLLLADSPDERLPTLVHELLHVVLSDLQWHQDQAIGQIANKKARRAASSAVKRSHQLICDRLEYPLAKLIFPDAPESAGRPVPVDESEVVS